MIPFYNCGANDVIQNGGEFPAKSHCTSLYSPIHFIVLEPEPVPIPYAQKLVLNNGREQRSGARGLGFQQSTHPDIDIFKIIFVHIA